MASPYLKAALITAAIVLLGLFFISTLDSVRANELQKSVDELSYQSESERLLFFYFQALGNQSDLCSYLAGTTQQRADRAYELSGKIAYYEKINVLNADYEKIRDRYYLSNAALYMNILAAKKYCGAGYKTVLYFYKIKGDCTLCRAQGGVLDALRLKHPQMMVFAFPLDTGLEFLNVLVARHGIGDAPALVIDDGVVLEGLQTDADLEKYLGGAQ